MELSRLDRLTLGTISNLEVIVTGLLVLSKTNIEPRCRNTGSRSLGDHVLDEFVGTIFIKVNSNPTRGRSTSKIIRKLIALTSSSGKVRMRRCNTEILAAISSRSSRD
jgi:hypothetical protein